MVRLMKDLYTYLSESRSLKDLKGKGIGKIEVEDTDKDMLNEFYICVYGTEYYGGVFMWCKGVFSNGLGMTCDFTLLRGNDWTKDMTKKFKSYKIFDEGWPNNNLDSILTGMEEDGVAAAPLWRKVMLKVSQYLVPEHNGCVSVGGKNYRIIEVHNIQQLRDIVNKER